VNAIYGRLVVVQRRERPTLEADDGILRAWGHGAIPKALGAIAVVYFAAIFTEAAKSGSSARWLPAPLAYFTQVAALFPGAARNATDYRVEGFRCRDKSWSEIDVSPWFPIDADNKESRFYRAIHFYGDQHPHRQTLRALDEFIAEHYDADAVDASARGDAREPIAGVRFVRLHVPVGTPGDGQQRYEKKPLSSYPDEVRKDLYYTPESKRDERCARLGAR
jgi:hypothetical protein